MPWAKYFAFTFLKKIMSTNLDLKVGLALMLEVRRLRKIRRHLLMPRIFMSCLSTHVLAKNDGKDGDLIQCSATHQLCLLTKEVWTLV